MSALNVFGLTLAGILTGTAVGLLGLFILSAATRPRLREWEWEILTVSAML